MAKRGSMYTDDYLDRGGGRTPATYLHDELSGKAKSYSGRYERVLRADLERLEAEGAAERVPSKGGSVAWRRKGR